MILLNLQESKGHLQAPPLPPPWSVSVEQSVVSRLESEDCPGIYEETKPLANIKLGRYVSDSALNQHF